MALIQDFVIKNTGLTVPNAYHIVTKVDVEKRVADIKDPVDNGRQDGLTNGGEQRTDNEREWKAGYLAKVTITVYVSREARENGSEPLGMIGSAPTDAPMDSDFGQLWKGYEPCFMLDTSEGAPSELTQAYNFLKTTTYFADAVED
tara:strand:- start:98 stop:535 length:438 start_codon:yes stop_codon:yes gene_type:complete